MKTQEKKCSSKEHLENDAISYCQICKLYMCNKCENMHAKLFPNHCAYNLNKDIKEIFTGICNEENHLNQLEYYCKNHNILCCAACISKIKGKGYGQHTDCNVCFIEEIKDQKQNKLKNNIKNLEELSNTLIQSINELKKILEKIDSNKEALKMKIQKIFTKIRNALNDREDELLSEIDKKFDNLFFNKEFIKEGETLPNKIKISIENGKKIDNEWNNDKLNMMIHHCINIENNIDDMNKINEKINKYNSVNIDIKFTPENDDEINQFIEKIKNFGNIYKNEIDWIDSKIVNSLNEKEKLKMLIFSNNSISSKILYRLSRDGESINTFHKLCDNINNNLIIIETENNKIFRCYCTWIWDTSGNDLYINNEKDLFSLTKNQIFYEQKLRVHKGCGDHGPYIYEKFYFNKTMKICQILNSQFIDNTGNINIKEVEIYQIEKKK